MIKAVYCLFGLLAGSYGTYELIRKDADESLDKSYIDYMKGLVANALHKVTNRRNSNPMGTEVSSESVPDKIHKSGSIYYKESKLPNEEEIVIDSTLDVDSEEPAEE